MVAATARLGYGQNDECLPMRHHTCSKESKKTVTYEWPLKNQWCRPEAQALGAPEPAGQGSLEQFMTEHYGGYSTRRRGSLEYHLAHAPWQVWVSASAELEGDVSRLYGAELGRALQGRPSSAFIADGSPVTVFSGSQLA
jgi:hypothetical protein